MPGGNRELFRNLLLSIAIVFIVSMAIFMGLGIYSAVQSERQAFMFYDSILDTSMRHLDTLMESDERAVISTLYYNNGVERTDLKSDDLLTRGIAARNLQNYMEQEINTSDNSCMLFVYNPERDLKINTAASIGSNYTESRALWQIITARVEESGRPDGIWHLEKAGDRQYFMTIFSVDDIYAGAVIDAGGIADDLNLTEDGSTALFLPDDQISIKPTDLKRPWMSRKIDFVKPVSGSDFSLLIELTPAMNSRNLYVYIVLLILAVMVVTFIFTANLHYQKQSLINPLVQLQQAMLSFGKGNLDIRLGKAKNKDIDDLYQTFNQMTEQIKLLKIQVYDDKLEKQTIMSNYLKLQIQPHFYANILNIIYGLAGLQDYRKIQALSKSTAEYFRYLLAEKGTFHPLGNELTCVHDFAAIQEIRYESMISFDLQVDESLMEQPVPPMIILTFLNNAVKHNITYVEKLVIKVSACSTGQNLVIGVEDNGRGMDPELAARITDRDYNDQSGKHVGISNLIQRMNMLYQGSWSIRISTEKGEGTSVKLTIPLIAQEGNSENENTHS